VTRFHESDIPSRRAKWAMTGPILLGMRSAWWCRWERPTMRLYPDVKVCFQNVRRLFLPAYFTVLSNAGNKAEQSVLAVKREGPNPVVRHNCQIGLNNSRPRIRRRSTNQLIPRAWDRECFCRFERVFRWSGDCCRQSIVSKRIYPTSRSHSYVPKKARGHHIGNFHIPIIGNAEFR